MTLVFRSDRRKSRSFIPLFFSRCSTEATLRPICLGTGSLHRRASPSSSPSPPPSPNAATPCSPSHSRACTTRRELENDRVAHKTRVDVDVNFSSKSRVFFLRPFPHKKETSFCLGVSERRRLLEAERFFFFVFVVFVVVFSRVRCSSASRDVPREKSSFFHSYALA